ncbi:hypothetical protein C8T65DRAFT_655135 [Cerioporus squamosus]|nr:hypothetical protein C8T65DRAFT_655135 [Cerioporus squamosus]
MSTSPSDRVRLAILISPKPGMTPDECRSYWRSNHFKVFSSIAVVKRNLLKYEQFHFDPKYTAAMTAMIPGYKPPPFFGMAIFEAETMDKIAEVFQDEEYNRVVVPDEERFMSRKDALIVGGPTVTII